jgi:hypothetical protein
MTLVEDSVAGGPTPAIAEAPTSTASLDTKPGRVVGIRRRTIDTVLVAAGAVVTLVLAVAGVLFTWGSNFAEDYVHKELSSQQIFFPDRASLEEEGRTDLVGYAEQQVTTGDQAEAYASYIGGHLEGIADGMTYAELGAPERAAKAAVQAATENGESEAVISDLQAEADAITNQRTSLFKGETLRGLLLSTYAWSTIGRIAGIAAVTAFVAAGAMFVLVLLGVVHRVRMQKS